MRDEDIDLVYILKPTDVNPELKWSLRSIERFCTFRKVWAVGHRPSWVQGMDLVHTEQRSTKWKNSTLNLFAACRTEGITERFVLMNDDFVAAHEVHGWEEECNVCLGTIDARIERSASEKPSAWRRGFRYTRALLELMGSKSFLNFEAHFPMVVDKYRFLEVMAHPLLQWFVGQEGMVLQKRSVYRNLTLAEGESPRVIEDVKLREGADLSRPRLRDGWVSFYDGVVDNPSRFPLMNRWLREQFPRKSGFEK